jgi:RIO-like serine/threonine protein kinase
VLKGLSSLYSAGWNHGRVREENVVVGSDGHFKLFNFRKAVSRMEVDEAVFASLGK